MSLDANHTSHCAGGADSDACALSSPAAEPTSSVSGIAVAMLVASMFGIAIVLVAYYAQRARVRGRLERVFAAMTCLGAGLLLLSAIVVALTSGSEGAEPSSIAAGAQAIGLVCGSGMPLAWQVSKGIALSRAIRAGSGARRSAEGPRSIVLRAAIALALDWGVISLFFVVGSATFSQADIDSGARAPTRAWALADSPAGAAVLGFLALVRTMQCLVGLFFASRLEQAPQQLAKSTASSLRSIVLVEMLTALLVCAMTLASSDSGLLGCWALVSILPPVIIVMTLYWKALQEFLDRTLTSCCAKDGYLQNRRKARRDHSNLSFLPAPIRIGTASSVGTATSDAMHEVIAELLRKLGGARPSFMVVHYTEQHDPATVRAALKAKLPNTPFVGCSTSCGVMHDKRWVSKDDCAIGAWGILDKEGNYSVGGVELKGVEDIPAAVSGAARAALKRKRRRSMIARSLRPSPRGDASPSVQGSPVPSKFARMLSRDVQCKVAPAPAPMDKTDRTASHDAGFVIETAEFQGRVATASSTGVGGGQADRIDSKPSQQSVSGAERVRTSSIDASPLARGSSGTGTPGRGAPSFAWVHGHPGTEERVMGGLKEVLGHAVPIVGGSAADNLIEGKWSQICSASEGVFHKGVVFALCWPVVAVKSEFFSAYSPQSRFGQVTEASDREVRKINGLPAAQVYNAWTGNQLGAQIAEAASTGKAVNILAACSMFPLGLRKGFHLDGEPYFQLLHPHMVRPDGTLMTGASCKAGDHINLMGATRATIASRVGRGAVHMFQDTDFHPSELKGGLGVFGGGCMLAAKTSMGRAAIRLSESVGGVPMLSFHSFGEQGQFPSGESCHSNLMFSTVVFSNRRLKWQEQDPRGRSGGSEAFATASEAAFGVRPTSSRVSIGPAEGDAAPSRGVSAHRTDV